MSEPSPRDLYFVAPGDISKGRVEPISWMQTCAAYVAAGLNVTLVTLVVRRPDGVRTDEIWDHYGVAKAFRVISAPTPLTHASGTTSFRLWATTTASTIVLPRVMRSAMSRRRPIVHARTPVQLAPFVFGSRAIPRCRRPLLLFETHSLPRPANRWIVRAADLVVVNSERLATDLTAAFELPKERVLCAGLPPFNNVRPSDKAAARSALALDENRVLACYTGKMTREHNEFLLQTALITAKSTERFQMLLVGGNPEILEWTRRRARELDVEGSILLAGFVAPVNVGTYQAAADVLVYHMPESMGIFQYTTPAKGYEYQAMERPIVATDFPLFGEVFGADGERAIRVTDRTPSGLAGGIARALSLPDGGREMSARAAAFVHTRTWQRRASEILEALHVA